MAPKKTPHTPRPIRRVPRVAAREGGPLEQEKNASFRLSPGQRERMRALLNRADPRWTRTEWLACFMAVHEQLERVVATLPDLGAYAVQHHLALPASRRKAADWEWMLDALGLLAKERLEDLKAKGELPPEQ